MWQENVTLSSNSIWNAEKSPRRVEEKVTLNTDKKWFQEVTHKQMSQCSPDAESRSKTEELGQFLYSHTDYITGHFNIDKRHNKLKTLLCLTYTQ